MRENKRPNFNIFHKADLDWTLTDPTCCWSFVWAQWASEAVFGEKIMHANKFILVFEMKKTKNILKRRKLFTFLLFKLN